MDPEAKRKAIGAGFIRVFDEFAKGLEAKHGIKPRFLVQVRAPHAGTLANSGGLCGFGLLLLPLCRGRSYPTVTPAVMS